MLDRLFDADRASLITSTVLGVIREFGVSTTQLHNDSTTVTVTGNYPDADGRERAGKPTPKITQGHNKDFRPDLKQLLFILTVSADGAVPIAYRVADGNTPDDLTHIPTWEELRALVGHSGFLDVADSKLCSQQAMRHIASNGGRFVTIVPHGRREDTWFRDWAQTHAPDWQEADRRPGSRLDDPDRIWRTFEAPVPSTDGYRVIWVHSSSKAARDAATRAARIEAGLAAIDTVAVRLASPKTRLKTKVAAGQAAHTALANAGAARWVGFTITETTEVAFRQQRRWCSAPCGSSVRLPAPPTNGRVTRRKWCSGPRRTPKGVATAQIADGSGVSEQTVRQRLRRHGVAVPRPARRLNVSLWDHCMAVSMSSTVNLVTVTVTCAPAVSLAEVGRSSRGSKVVRSEVARATQ